MKHTFSCLLLSALALLGLTSCLDPMYGGGPGYSSSYHPGHRSYGSYNNSRSGAYYGGVQRNSRTLGYRPNDPDDRNNPRHPNYVGRSGSRSRSGTGYYPNDPDDRNNPNHPDYRNRSRQRPAPSYYANDPDDRNNPNHPDYRGRSHQRPAPSYHANDPDDRNNPRHPDYQGPPRRR